MDGRVELPQRIATKVDPMVLAEALESKANPFEGRVEPSAPNVFEFPVESPKPSGSTRDVFIKPSMPRPV